MVRLSPFGPDTFYEFASMMLPGRTLRRSDLAFQRDVAIDGGEEWLSEERMKCLHAI